jgi:hypothetical protein
MHHIVAAALPSWATALAFCILLEAVALTSSIPAYTMRLEEKRTTAAQQGRALQDDTSKKEATETNSIARFGLGRNLGFHPESAKPS